MTRRRQQTDTPLDRISEILEEAPLGLHDLRSLDEVAAEAEADAGPDGTGADVASVVVPVPLSEIYLVAGAGTLFHETLEIFPPNQLGGDPELGVRFGTCDGDDLWLDARGRVRRFDPSLDQVVAEGTRIDRWLWGVLDGYAHLVDHEGEFAEDAFDDEGELTDDCALRILAAQLRRDPSAVGPRLRRASVLARSAIDLARAELEEVVRLDPDLPWGWSELAKISETKGELPGAIDEARAAAESAEKLRHPQAGYFWAQLARLFNLTGDEASRAAAAAKTIRLAPELKAAQIAGATAELEAGDVHAAERLVELLRAVWPKDLEVIDLRRRIEQRTD